MSVQIVNVFPRSWPHLGPRCDLHAKRFRTEEFARPADVNGERKEHCDGGVGRRPKRHTKTINIKRKKRQDMTRQSQWNGSMEPSIVCLFVPRKRRDITNLTLRCPDRAMRYWCWFLFAQLKRKSNHRYGQ